jgi:hypothetical protein
MGKRIAMILSCVGAAALALHGVGSPAAGDPPATRTYVFSAEDNRLHAYDAATHARQTVIPSAGECAGACSR